MKKNKALRTASALLVMVLLTTSVIGSTFAKYVTSGSASDTARVAKWGVAITASGSLYSNAYARSNAANGNLPAAWTKNNNTLANGISVATAAGTEGNIVAPGTKSYDNGLSFGISGKPEVAVTVKTTIEAEDIYLKAGTYGMLVPAVVGDTESLQKFVAANGDRVYGFKNHTYTKLSDTSTYENGTKYYVLTDKVTFTKDYFPVKYTLTGSTDCVDVKAVEAAAALANAVKAGSNNTVTGSDAAYKASYPSISADFAANTDLGAETAAAGMGFGKENLKWEWAFEDAAIADKDLKDTILGDLIAVRGAAADPGYVVVAVDAGAVTALDVSDTEDDYTVKGKNGAVVANLRTQFAINIEVTQLD